MVKKPSLFYQSQLAQFRRRVSFWHGRIQCLLHTTIYVYICLKAETIEVDYYIN